MAIEMITPMGMWTMMSYILVDIPFGIRAEPTSQGIPSPTLYSLSRIIYIFYEVINYYVISHLLLNVGVLIVHFLLFVIEI